MEVFTSLQTLKDVFHLFELRVQKLTLFHEEWDHRTFITMGAWLTYLGNPEVLVPDEDLVGCPRIG